MEQYIIARGPLGGFHNNADGNDSDRLITRSKKILASRPEVLLSKSIHGAASSTSLY
jgi:hypothetical protein